MKIGFIEAKIGNQINETIKDVLTASSLIFVSIGMSLLVFRENWLGLLRNRIPLAGDGLLTGLYIKTVEKSDYRSLFFQNISSAQYGWPGKLDFTSYPVGNTQEMLAVKIFMDLTGIIDPSQIIHIFSILKAAPIAVATFILARVLGIHRLLSALIGLIFTFNTYNLVRAEGHFFLALTWSVPLGLAAIFIAFNQVLSGKNPSRKIFIFGLLLSLFSFMTGFYYSFFLVIFSIISIIFLFLRLSQEDSGQSLFRRMKNAFHQLHFPILILLVYMLGLLLQTVPVLIRNMSTLKLTGLADRSVTESVIYSGTPESLLFDFYSFGLRMLNRPDLVAYLQTRISWEGAQVGALSGAILVAAFFLLLGLGLTNLLATHQRENIHGVGVNKSLNFVLIMLSTSLLLYFVSPINFTISRFLPQIRAWGRLSVVISLLSLLLLGFFLTKLNRSQLVIYPMAIIMVTVPILEYNQFRQNRPPSLVLNDAAISQNTEFTSTLTELQKTYANNCSLINLPLYPFPEFDRPDDKNIDYGQLQLSMLDDGYFRWSYGGIKATENFRVWQPLVSEFPPFARASIANQITYGYFAGACGAVVDRSYLNVQEMVDLQRLIANATLCTLELDGPMFDNQPRFVNIKYQGNICKSKSDPELEQLAGDSLGNHIAWRVDQSSEIGFKDSYQMFSISTSINVRLRLAQSSNVSGVILRVRLTSENLAANSSRTLTVTNFENGETKSYRIKFDTDGLGWLELPANFTQGGLKKLTISLTNEGQGEIDTWGIQLGTRY